LNDATNKPDQPLDHPAAVEPHASSRRRRVIVEGYELTGSVGVYAHERKARQPLVVSLNLAVEDDYDGVSDRLDDVYDYDIAIGAIHASVEAGHINLLETIAERIATACLEDHRVLEVNVRVEKPAVLPDCRCVGIEICRPRPRESGG
jgi:7,8-dihydroneopterin aldolase/epimerase/oxygenase